MSKNVGVKVTLKSTDELLADRGIGGRVQKVIDNEVMRRMEPYMQLDTKTMIDSMQLATEPGSGEIIVDVPYAHMRLHSGPTKGLRGPNYFERMKADHKDDLLRIAANKAGGKAEK